MRLPRLQHVWLLFPLAAVLIAASVEPLPPYDFWWHLVMGRVLDAGTFPDANHFLYTLPRDQAFHDQPWLAQWLMYRVHEAGGLVGGMVLRSGLLLAAWCALSWGLVRRSSPKLGGFLAVMVAVVSYPVLTYRTRLFAFLPFIVLLLVLLDERRTKWAPLVVLVATAFWANVHGTFVLSPVLVFGCAGAVALEALSRGALREVAGREGYWWGATAVAACIGSLATPHGFDNLKYVVHLAVSSNVSATVSEWLPPDLTTGVGAAWGLAFVATLILMVWRRREATILEVALLLATTYLAASAIRSVFWWAATAALVVAPHLRALAVRIAEEGEAAEDEGNLLNAGLMAAMIASVFLIHPGTAPNDVREALGGGRLLAEGGYVLSNENAVAETRLALDRAGDGRVFHDQALGGLLEWLGTTAEAPRPVAFVDQRMELIPESVWEEYFAVSASVGWESAFDEHDVRAAVLAPASQWPLIQALDASPGWELVRVGPAHVVYVKKQLGGSTRSR